MVRRMFLLTVVLSCAAARAEEAADQIRPLHTLRGHQRWVQSLAISTDSQWLVSGGDDQTLRLWNLKTGGKSLTLRRYDGAVTAVAFHPDGKRIAVGTYDGELQVCEAASGKLSRTLERQGVAEGKSVDDGGRSIIKKESADDTLVTWDARDGTELLTFQQGNEYDVTTAAFSPDGKRILTGDGENELKIWDTDNGDEVRTLRGHSETVTSAAYSPSGKQIVSASWDDTLRLWDADTGDDLKTLRGHTADITSVLFTRDGSQIVSCGEDRTLRIWDAGTGKLSRTIPAHPQAVLCLAVSPDGRLLVSGSKEEIRVWPLK